MTPTTSTTPRWYHALRPTRLPQILWLTTVWLLLWGTVSATTVVGGLLVALAVTAAFPLPPMPGHVSIRPLRLLRLAGYLAAELVVSSVNVSREALRHGPRATAGIIELPLLTDSEQAIAALANAVSLAPGEFVLQIDCERGVIYIYALGVRGPSDADRVREQVMALQRQVVAALGAPRAGVR